MPRLPIRQLWNPWLCPLAGRFCPVCPLEWWHFCCVFILFVTLLFFFPLPSFKDWPSLSSRSGSYSPHSWKVQVYFLHLLLSYLDCDQFPQLLCASCFVLYCNRNETISVLPELLVVVISLFWKTVHWGYSSCGKDELIQEQPPKGR